jgi:hypothetical protein
VRLPGTVGESRSLVRSCGQGQSDPTPTAFVAQSYQISWESPTSQAPASDLGELRAYDVYQMHRPSVFERTR